ncbi:hypothetical protein CMUS01_09139 [Colletotrichum musicola]|uniref:protein S-acyltransferase n=1 Tax=Colletotrichum musicola TaxID=2175873 RepID=A0A8H6NBC2_9PEZI|nr:hypothetical protein CMUS01_09139 [Colletotrichum musicola]
MSKSRALFLRSFWLFALLIIFPSHIMAGFLEEGDDFSNNLASDIAPLLALFGESVTTQFMSQSTGWADCIMLAVAPIGVITVIVSAIRVGGYTWLKAVVGRARENIVAAELEVMSSTSKEACELWNGRNVVRCPGAADICEFICLYPTETDRKDITSARIMDIEKATSSEENSAEDHRSILRICPKKRDRYFPGLSARLRKVKRRFLLSWHWHKQEESSDTSHIDGGESGQSRSPQQQSSMTTGRNSPSKNNTNQKNNRASPSGTTSKAPGKHEIVILRNRKHPAPNISLNCQADGHRWPLWLCAAITVVFQAGALLYFGFVTEYHTLKFEKEGEPVQDYTMPLAVTGTVCLVLGMLICVHVVNKASEETRWELTSGKEHAISMIWLQKRKQVSDQQFESKAIFPEKKRNQFVTSARAIGVEQDDAGQPSQTSTRGEGQPSQAPGMEKGSNPKKEEKILVRWLQMLSFVGVFISLAGSVCQFTGLRGMHWTASIAQLGAVALATFVRAVVRRALTHDIKQQDLKSGYELDWFVMSLSNMQTAVWFPPENKSAWQRFCSKVGARFGQSDPANAKIEKSRKTVHPAEKDKGSQSMSDRASSCLWTIETGLPKLEIMTCATKETENQQCRKDQDQYRQVDGIHTAQGVLDLRRYLGELGNWKSPVFAEAVALSKAIEITMGYFEDHLKKPKNQCFTWTLQVKVGYDNKAKLGDFGAYGRLSNASPEPVEFHVEKTESGWQARVDELDSALSLWLYSVYSSKGNQKNTRAVFPSGNDDWIRGEKIRDQCLQIIGPSSFRLLQDLKWWMPNGLEGIKTSGLLERDETHWQEPSAHDVRIERIGHAGQRSPSFKDLSFSQRLSNPIDGNVTRWNLEPTESWNPIKEDAEEQREDRHLVVEFQDSLPRLYAKDIFASFVWALAHRLETSSVGKDMKAIVQSDDARGWGAWKKFTLRSLKLSRLVQSIVELGPWTEQEVYLSLIPPMSASDNLPGLDGVVDLALEVAAVEEKRRKYQDAVDAHIWLYETAEKFPSTSHIYWKSVAALMCFHARLIGPEVQSSPFRFEGWYWKDPWKPIFLHHTGQTLEKIKFPTIRKKLEEVFDIYNVQTRHVLKEVSKTELRYFPVRRQSPMPIRAPYGSSEYRDIFNRTGLHHAARSTSLNSMLEAQEETVEVKQQISDVCEAQFNPSDWVKIISWQHSELPGGWNPVDWREAFTSAMVDPAKWLRAMMDEGADPDTNAKDLNHWTPLHYACYTVLHGHGLDGINETVRKGLTDFFHSRAQWWAQLLIRSNANVNAQGLDGTTPLHCAVMSRNLGLVGLLIENNADMTAEDARGLTPFHLAAMWDAPELFEKFSKWPCWPDARDSSHRTPVHFAALSGATKSLIRLRELEAELDSRDVDDQTPLHFAAHSVATKSILELCNLGATLDFEDNEGLTPLTILVTSDDSRNRTEDTEEAALELVTRGASVDGEDYMGRNLLHHAAINGHVQLAIALIENAKSPREMFHKLNRDGRTPRSLVRSQGGKLGSLIDETWKQLEEIIEADENAGGHGAAMQSSTMDEEEEA